MDPEQGPGRSVDMEEAITALECAALPLPRHRSTVAEMADHLLRLFTGGWSSWNGTQAAGWLDALSALTRVDGVSPILLHGGVLGAMAQFASKRTAKMDSHNLIVVLNNLLIDAPQQASTYLQHEPHVENLATAISRAMKGGISSKRVACTAVQLWLAHGPIEVLGKAGVPAALATCIATSIRKLGHPEHDAALRSFSILLNHDPGCTQGGDTTPEALAVVLLGVGIDRSLHEDMRREALRALALQAGTVTYERSDEATSEEVTCMLNVLCNPTEPRAVACAAAAVLVPAFGAVVPPLQGQALLRTMEQRRLLQVLVELVRRADTEADDRCDVLLLLGNIIDKELCEGVTSQVGQLLVQAQAVAAIVDMLKRLCAAKTASPDGANQAVPLLNNNYGIIGNAGETMPQPDELGKMLSAAALVGNNLLECDEAVQRQCMDFGLPIVLKAAEAHPELLALRTAQAEQEAEFAQLEAQRAEAERQRQEQEKQRALEQQQRAIAEQLKRQQEEQARMLAEQQRLQQEQLRLQQEASAAAAAREAAEQQKQEDASRAAAAAQATAAPQQEPAAPQLVADGAASIKRAREDDEDEAAREAIKPRIEEAGVAPAEPVAVPALAAAPAEPTPAPVEAAPADPKSVAEAAPAPANDVQTAEAAVAPVAPTGEAQ